MELKTKYVEKINEEKQGKELYFEKIPTEEERKQLKANGYRWHNVKKCWFIKLSKQNTAVSKNNNNELTNYLGVKVGDIFYSSWGYEQTNVDFFQVVALKGKTQAIIKEVYLKIESEEGISGMSADRIYNKNTCTIVKNSIFVKDNEKGQIKKILGTKENPYINISSFANAYKYDGQKLYESWYY